MWFVIVAHDHRGNAEYHFKHVLARKASGEKCLDVCVRSKASFAHDDRREAMQGFKLRIRQRAARR
jgi:hypothetical protein